MSPQIHVAVAVIINKSNEVLVSLRPEESHLGGYWEFPGGKLESGESIEDALKREIFEELNITVQSAHAFKQIRHQYTDKNILLDVWLVDSFSGVAEGAEGQQIKWQVINELNLQDFPAANRAIIHALKLPEKYMITGAFDNHDDFKGKLENSLKQGISLVQLRCKNTSREEYARLVKIALPLCKKYAAILLLNTDVDTFSQLSADGLHLSSQALQAMVSRPVESSLLLSVSCHSIEEVEKARQLEADIILLSPVKETKSHPGVAGIGWEKFREISLETSVPVYALGGMKEADIDDALSSGVVFKLCRG